VSIDGRLIVTTPTARPIPLVPGEHFIKLENPFFEAIDRRVVVTPNQTQWLDVTFESAVTAPQRGTP